LWRVLACFDGQPQRVADEVGHVLDLRHLVVVGEDDRVAFLGKAADRALQIEGGHEITSREKSRTPAGGARAPSETKSTPLPPTAARLSSVMPPLASRRARPAVCWTA